MIFYKIIILYGEDAKHQMTGRYLVFFHVFLVIDLLYILLDLNSF